MGNSYCCCQERDKNEIYKMFSRKAFLGMKHYTVNRDYDIDRLLGLGTYGQLRLAKNKRIK